MESNENELKFLYLVFDLFILNTVILFMYSISPHLSIDNIPARSLMFLLFNMAYLITVSLFTVKNIYLHDDYSNKVRRIINRIFIFTVVSLLLAHLTLVGDFSNLFIFETIILFFFGQITYYYFLYSYIKIRRSKGYYVHRVLIVGLNDMSFFLRQLLNNNPLLGYEFIGYVSEEPVQDKDVVGVLDELAPIVEKNQIDFLFVTQSSYNDLKKSKELLAICNKIGVRLRFVPENQYWFKTKMNLESVGSLAVINPQEIPLDVVEARFVKRVFDVVFSTLVIIFIISWLFPILSILIKMESTGPVFFKQKRTGINNKTFTCLKFRSMCVSDDANDKQCTVGDARITKLGKFLRKSNIDEFPQFFNVLFGQMSIVGPRPHMLKHTEQYSELIEYYKVRHYVKPGITGWAQVNGYRGETDELWKMEKRVEYDMIYLENWSFWLDIRIVFMTVFGKNAHKNAM